MIIGSNDIKSSCRAMLISAKQAKSGGGGGGGSGEIQIPDVPDPPSWVYPEEFWITKPASATDRHITGIICIKKASTNRSVRLSLWAESGASSMGFMSWGDNCWESIEVTTSSASTRVWGVLDHTYYAGTGHSLYIYGEEYEQWAFEISLYNFGDYSDSKPVYFAGMYNTTSDVVDRPSLQWLSIGSNVRVKDNSEGQISSTNDKYRIFGREGMLEYVEIGKSCQLTARAFEPVSGITSNLKEVAILGELTFPAYLLYNCKMLSKITGADNITVLAANSFSYCSSLIKLVCPNATLVSTPTGCDALRLLTCRRFGQTSFNLNAVFFAPDE